MKYTGYVALGVPNKSALFAYTRQEDQKAVLPGDIRCGTWDTRKEAQKEADEVCRRLKEDDIKAQP